MVASQKNTFDRIHFPSKTYTWNTPQDLFKDLDEEFHFNFDPAYPPIIGNYDENALTKRWMIKRIKTKLRIYLNPPYDRKLMERFIKKTWQEMSEGRAEIAVFLLPLRSTALRFLVKLQAKKENRLEAKLEFRILEKRLHFGDAENGAPFDSVIAILQA